MPWMGRLFNQNSTNFLIVSEIINRLINDFEPLTIVRLAILINSKFNAILGGKLKN